MSIFASCPDPINPIEPDTSSIAPLPNLSVPPSNNSPAPPEVRSAPIVPNSKSPSLSTSALVKSFAAFNTNKPAPLFTTPPFTTDASSTNPFDESLEVTAKFLSPPKRSILPTPSPGTAREINAEPALAFTTTSLAIASLPPASMVRRLWPLPINSSPLASAPTCALRTSSVPPCAIRLVPPLITK